MGRNDYKARNDDDDMSPANYGIIDSRAGNQDTNRALRWILLFQNVQGGWEVGRLREFVRGYYLAISFGGPAEWRIPKPQHYGPESLGKE